MLQNYRVAKSCNISLLQINDIRVLLRKCHRIMWYLLIQCTEDYCCLIIYTDYHSFIAVLRGMIRIPPHRILLLME